MKAAFSANTVRRSEFAAAASQSRLHAIVSARDLISRQQLALDGAWDSLGFRFTDEILRWNELQFLWGVFHEAVAHGPEFPTNGYDRILLHLIDFLMRERGLAFQDAKRTALRVERMFNEADCLFDAIERRGRLAYRRGSDQHFIQIVLALNETRLPSDDAYI